MKRKVKKKKKCHDKDEVQQALRNRFNIVLRLYPGISLVFGFILWAIFDNGLSYVFITIIPATFLWMHFLITYRSFFKFARHTTLVNALGEIFVVYCFIALASACIFRLLGMNGLIIGVVAVISAAAIIIIKCNKYWSAVWESHREQNENCALDLENARYDYLNPFNMDEYKVRKKTGKQNSNPAVSTIIAICALIGVGIGMRFSGKSQVIFIIGVVGGLIFALYALKSVSHTFYLYRKLAYYEKQIGKPIINGLV